MPRGNDVNVVVLTVAVVVIYALIQDQRQIKKEDQSILQEKCLEELGMPTTWMNEEGKSNFMGNELFKCFVKCLYVKTGVMDSNGDINYDKLAETIEEPVPNLVELRASIIDRCNVDHITDSCEASYYLSQCIDRELATVSTKDH